MTAVGKAKAPRALPRVRLRRDSDATTHKILSQLDLVDNLIESLSLLPVNLNPVRPEASAAMHTAVMIWIAYMLCLASAGAMRENIHAATAVATFHASNASANASDEQKIEAIVVEARAAEDVQGQNQLAWDNDFNQAKQDPFESPAGFPYWQGHYV
eukprot:Skav221032  [mRNA]  locus=scaffold1448:93779:99201:+ [translate_table: standard]